MTRPVQREAAPRPVVPSDPRLTLASAIEPLLAIRTLAAYLAVDERTVHRMIAAGRLPPPDLWIGTGRRGAPRWRKATIDAWVAGGGQ
jgi:excisionase family DNA binding protein